MNDLKSVLWAFAIISTIFCSFAKAKKVVLPEGLQGLHIVAYNIENLFDTHHDEGKNDWEFTPKDLPGKRAGCLSISNSYYRKKCLTSDWNTARYEMKLLKIKEALSFNSQNLPDMLALVEIENKKVVGDLAEVLGFSKFFLSKSLDKRGIDVALLFNETKSIKSLGMKEHIVANDPYFEKHPTRNILEVLFEIDGIYSLSLFVNHWPSQGSPGKGKYRTRAAEVLKKAYLERLASNPKQHIMAMGDFNTLAKDRPHPFDKVLYSGQYPLKDVSALHKSSFKVSDLAKIQLPLGTYFYPKEMSWNHLDRFFVGKNLSNSMGLDVLVSSFDIYTHKITRDFYYTRRLEHHFGSVIKNIPKRYNHQADLAEKAGFSDHFPISIWLTY